MNAFSCCYAPRREELPPPLGLGKEVHKAHDFYGLMCAGKPDEPFCSPTSSFPTTPSQHKDGEVHGATVGTRPATMDKPLFLEDDRSLPGSSLTIAAACVAAATGFIFSTTSPWFAKAAIAVLAVMVLAAATLAQQQPSRDEHIRRIGEAEAAHLAEEAREVRDRTWRHLGLQGTEVAKVRELLQRLRNVEGLSSSKGRGMRRTRTAAGTDFVTAWRFLRAHGWALPAAEATLRAAISRDEGLQELDAPLIRSCRQLARHWRGHGLAGVDFDGDPVLWEQPGLLDWQGLNTVNEELVVCCEMLCLQRLALELDRLTVQEQRPVHRVGVVVDLEGLPMSFARPQNLKLFSRIARMDSEQQPEMLKWVLLVNPPRKFAAVWKVIEPYFDAGTRKKFKIVPPEETQAELLRHVPRESLPRFLGGPSRQPQLLCAGKIPRKLLRELSAHSQPTSLATPPPREEAAGSLAAVSAASMTCFSMPPLASDRHLSLTRLGRGLHFTSNFGMKENCFPRSSWAGPGGTLPTAHSWGSLSDASAFPAPRRAPRGGAAARPFMELLDVDVFRSSEGDPVLQAYEHTSLAAQHFRRQGETRFLFVVNFILGPYQQVTVAAMNRPPADGSVPGAASDWQLWNRFLQQSEAAKGRTLRVSATCFEGPCFVQELLRAQKATHLGRFLPSFTNGDNYLEVTVHLASSEMRRLRVVFQHSYHLIANGLAYHLDGPVESQDRLLFAHYCAFVDVQRLRQV